MKEAKTIVFCDTQNKEIDLGYAEKVRQSFRELTGWKVEEGTRIWNVLGDFSMGYSREQRNTIEVATIFAIALFGGIPHE